MQNGLKSIAFSALSTGVYGYPSDEAAEVAIKEVRRFLVEEDKGGILDRVVFCCFERKDERAYEEWLPYDQFLVFEECGMEMLMKSIANCFHLQSMIFP